MSPILLYTGIECDKSTKAKLKKFNASLVDRFTRRVTHLVLEQRPRGQLKRTLKLLTALAMCPAESGPTIVHEGWVQQCIKMGRVVNESDFVAKRTGLTESALKRRELSEQGLFSGMCIHVTKSVKPPPKKQSI